MRLRTITEPELLRYAYRGLEVVRDHILAQAEELAAEIAKNPLENPNLGIPFGFAAVPKRHTMSAEGRARIAAAQRKRWANRPTVVQK